MKRILLETAVVLITGGLLAGCASPSPQRPVDEVLAQKTSLACRLYREGRVREAALQYREAIDRAWAVYDQQGIADNAYNLAACRIDQGRYADALQWLAQAREQVAANHVFLRDIQVLRAQAEQGRGSTNEALAVITRLVAENQRDLPATLALLLQAEIYCQQRDSIAARASLQAAQENPDALQQPAVQARATMVEGAVDRLTADWPGAVKAFDRAARLFRKAKMYDEMAAAMAQAADSAEQDNNTRDAAQRWLDVARCRYGQKQYPAALDAVDRAMTAAHNAGDHGLQSGIQALFEEIRDIVEENRQRQRLSNDG